MAVVRVSGHGRCAFAGGMQFRGDPQHSKVRKPRQEHQGTAQEEPQEEPQEELYHSTHEFPSATQRTQNLPKTPETRRVLGVSCYSVPFTRLAHEEANVLTDRKTKQNSLLSALSAPATTHPLEKSQRVKNGQASQLASPSDDLREEIIDSRANNAQTSAVKIHVLYPLPYLWSHRRHHTRPPFSCPPPP